VKNLIFSIQGDYFGRAVSYLFEGGEAFSESTMKSIGTIIEQSISRGHLGAAIFIAVAPVLIFPVLHFIVKKIIKVSDALSFGKRFTLWALESIAVTKMVLVAVQNHDAVYNTAIRTGDSLSFLQFFTGFSLLSAQGLLLMIPALIAHKFFTKQPAAASELEAQKA
jgi:hypothetical protein